MTYDPRDADPLTVDEFYDLDPYATPAMMRKAYPPEPIVREPSRWPLFVAVLIVVAAAVFVAQVAASRAARDGDVSTPATPLASALAETRAAHGQPGTLQNASRPVASHPADRDVALNLSVPRGSVPPNLPDTATAVQGKASWYCGGGSACTRGYPPGTLAGAAGPALRVGDWRGRIVKVCNAGGDRKTLCVRVQLVDWCACPRRVIDLYRSAFSRLASPSRGVLHVEVTWGGSTITVPPTDTARHGIEVDKDE